MSLVPSYGGWIKLRRFPLHLWNKEVFNRVGVMFGGFIDYIEENLSLIECLEVAIKVEENYCSFIPVEFDLIDDSKSFIVQVVCGIVEFLLIDKVAKIHGSFSLE